MNINLERLSLEKLAKVITNFTKDGDDKESKLVISSINKGDTVYYDATVLTKGSAADYKKKINSYTSITGEKPKISLR